ncbi:MAG TPA: fluoride efflux transporter CrcB [Candidatus Udaeobacter sp.]|jgi:CrcB protein|nr:fluoride efflux transporter CrcB [Candidatus Udaeobacter sp.]
MLKQAIIVALGGGLGSVARYKLGGFVLHHTQTWNFPVSTFSVNLLGCFAIGALAALVEHHDLFSSSARLFLFTGVLGGFTTFSAFGYESAFLLRRGMTTMAIAYAALSVVCAVAGVLLGLKTVDVLWWPRH